MKDQKQDIIQNYMEKLKISQEEAEQLYYDDLNDEIGEGEVLQEKTKSIKHRGQAKAPRKPANRTPKVDDEKIKIVDILQKALAEAGYNAIVSNAQRSIEIGTEFSVTLTKHRKK